jgi:hypothetical protein
MLTVHHGEPEADNMLEEPQRAEKPMDVEPPRELKKCSAPNCDKRETEEVKFKLCGPCKEAGKKVPYCSRSVLSLWLVRTSRRTSLTPTRRCAAPAGHARPTTGPSGTSVCAVSPKNPRQWTRRRETNLHRSPDVTLLLQHGRKEACSLYRDDNERREGPGSSSHNTAIK